MNTLTEVKVIRFLRPFNVVTGYPENLGGVTFIFFLDYEKRTLAIRHAICSATDNFQKKLGINTALNAPFVREFDLDYFSGIADLHGGFIDAYLQILTDESDRKGVACSPQETFLMKKICEQGLLR